MTSCIHYEQGNCRVQASVELRTVSFWPTIIRRDVRVEAPCPYSSVVWVGGRAFEGRHEDRALRQADCQLYFPVPVKEKPTAS